MAQEALMNLIAVCHPKPRKGYYKSKVSVWHSVCCLSKMQNRICVPNTPDEVNLNMGLRICILTGQRESEWKQAP